MTPGYIDHITVTAPSLDEGVAYVREALGVAPQAGGAHPRMGTHNRLLRLGADLFLEVIAADPAAAPPSRPRWFQLDDAQYNCRPRLATWVVRVAAIDAAAAACAFAPGAVEPMTRGALSWRITIPPDGRLALDGAAPALIEWDVAAHPAAAMPDLGCSLLGLEVCHPDAGRLRAMLAGLACAGPVRVAQLEAGAQPYLLALIRTPAGVRRLGGPD
ncbi:VOC family protein [Janthinobacterium fluminis]|uniref:VOC family protein n=1 Tax=Janthinobacterium fluminis TaxID=2987524 RepID=A0ABT5JXD4_9BURK|nr:VOC family protein [Janthinobacterium fluminis]MDC8756808.1 VOC family protein [Janthinobacterium fluminis]